MKYLIFFCLLLITNPINAEIKDTQRAEYEEAIERIENFVALEIDKEWKEYMNKLKKLTQEIKQAKANLRKIKFETLILKKGKLIKKSIPYTWPATKCERVPNNPDAGRCLWTFNNHDQTDVCQSWWVITSYGVYQETDIECKKIENSLKP